MGCNCGGGNGQALVYVYTAPNGAKTTYNSEVQAKAAKIKNGGGSYYPKVK